LPARSSASIAGRVDASLTYGNTNFLTQYLKGTDDKGFTGAATDNDWSGGFVAVDHAVSMDAVAFARYDWVNAPGSADLNAWVGGARWYFERNLAAHLEYGTRKAENGGAPEFSDTLHEQPTAVRTGVYGKCTWRF